MRLSDLEWARVSLASYTSTLRSGLLSGLGTGAFLVISDLSTLYSAGVRRVPLVLATLLQTDCESQGTP